MTDDTPGSTDATTDDRPTTDGDPTIDGASTTDERANAPAGGEPTDPPETPVTVPDPERLREHDDVAVEDRTLHVDAGAFEEHERWAGIAIVGVTDGEGSLLLLLNDDEHGRLPHGPVEDDEDFAAAARRTVDDQLDLAVTVDGVVRVRREEYRLEGEESGRTTVHQVLFRASPAGTVPENPTTGRGCWEARWVDEAPPNPDWDDQARDDVRRLLE